MSDSLMCTNVSDAASALACFEPDNADPIMSTMVPQPGGTLVKSAPAAPEPQQGAEHLMGGRQQQNSAASFVANRQPSPTNDNPDRSSSHPLTPMRSEAGVTTAGDAAYAEFALLSGEQQGVSVQVGDVSAQVGGQIAVAGAVARVAAETPDGSGRLSMEALTATATLGSYNQDGSLGVNAGADATYAAATYTHEFSGGGSLTLGGQLGAGAGVSAGIRDRDADGEKEYCASVNVGPVLAGACIEPSSVVEVFKQMGQWFSGR